VTRGLGPALGLCLLAGCGQVDSGPFVPNLSGNYTFLMEYAGPCVTAERPGRCAVDPVVLLQSETSLVVQPLGVGTIEELAIIFASDKVDVCDLSQASLTFSGIYNGNGIDGAVSGTVERSGFTGSCTIQDGTFSLTRTP
jgi:hypothetical protein